MLAGLPNMTGLPGVTAGGGITPSSSASATGGKIGDFNFNPKSSSTMQLVILAGAAVLAVLVMRR